MGIVISVVVEAPGLSSVYLREGHFLDGLRSLPPELTGGGDQDVADYLRANGLVIVYLGPDWILEELQPDAIATALLPTGSQPAFPAC